MRQKFQLKTLPGVCAGFLATGLGSSLFVYSRLGSDTFNVLAEGLAGLLGTQVGTMNYLQEIVLLLVVFLWQKQTIGPGTLLGSFLVGGTMNLCQLLFGSQLKTAGFVVRLACIFAAPMVIGFGVALIQKSGWGLVPNDIVPMLLHEHFEQFQYRTIRIFYDFRMFASGMIFGGTVGIGTIVSALLTGPCIQFWGIRLQNQCNSVERFYSKEL